jgi:hypothetical protein
MCAISVIPAHARSSNLDVATKFANSIQRRGHDALSRLVAPRIIWASQNRPEGKEVAAQSYGIYLEALNFKVGTVKSVACTAIDSVEVSCDFLRVSMFGGAQRHLTERYFVNDGKIDKIIVDIPPELLSTAKDG